MGVLLILVPGLPDPLCLEGPLALLPPAPPDIGVAFLEDPLEEDPLDPDFCLLDPELDDT